MSTHQLQETNNAQIPERAQTQILPKLLWNTDRLLQSIAPWEVTTDQSEVSWSGGYEFLVSYSWVQCQMPVIYSPGCPRKWAPPTLPQKLDPDKGRFWVDQHAVRTPTYPFEPIFQALRATNPTARFNHIDIVINRNSLYSLMEFVSGKRGRTLCLPLNMVHKTLLVSRSEESPTCRYHDTTYNPSYGHAFEAAFTEPHPELPAEDGHHRVVGYRFGGLAIAVRIEVDGYVEGGLPDPKAPAERSGASLQYSYTPSAPPDGHTTRVIKKGKLPAHYQSIELKTSKKAHKELIQQCWIGRTPFYCEGVHSNGVFTSAEVKKFGATDFEAWERKHQDRLRRLAGLLGMLRDITQSMPNQAAVVIRKEKGAPLQVFGARGSNGGLPRDVIDEFWG